MPADSARLPVSVLAAGLAFLGAWTLGVQAVTLARWPFAALQAALAFALLASACSLAFARRLEPVFSTDTAMLPAIRVQLAPLGTRAGVRTLLLILPVVLFIVAALIELSSSDFAPMYALLLATGAWSLARPRSARSTALLEFRPARTAAPLVGSALGMLMLAALMLLLYFMTSVPDADDCLYLNLAVGAKHARSAVYAADSMLGIAGLPLIKSTYRVESMQLLASVLSDLSGMSVIGVAHALIPAFLCLLAAAILTLVYRTLFGRAWFAPALMHLAWLMVMMPGLRSFGHDGITRFFHGKAFFLTAMVPLIAVLTVLAMRSPSRAHTLLLGTSLVAAIGLTANAVYVGPLTVGLAAAPLFLLGDGAQRSAALHLGIVLLYPALVIVALLALSPPAPSEMRFDLGLGAVLLDAFGSPTGAAAALVLMFGAAAAALLQRRLLPVSVAVLVALLVVFSPVSWRAYGEYVTGHLNYRLVWAVPFPLLLSIASGVLWISAPTAGRFAGAALLVAAVAAPPSGLLSLAWGFAPVKVPRPEYDIAREVNALSPRGALILAPEEISTWIPTLEDARPVVEGRGIYTTQRARFMPADQYRDRWMLFAWVSQFTPGEVHVAAYLPALCRLGVRVVVVRSPSAAQRAIRGDPQAGDFTLVKEIDPYQIFFTGPCPNDTGARRLRDGSW